MSKVYSWHDIIIKIDDLKKSYTHVQISAVRHAETEYNLRKLVTGAHDVNLTEAGREAAEQIASQLPSKIDLVVSSALKRARDTADIAASFHQSKRVRILIDKRLNEINLGVLEGRKKIFIPQFAAGDIDYAPAEGESYRSAAQRVFSAIADLQTEVDAVKSHIVVVLFVHAGVMRILSTLSGRDWSAKDMFSIDFKNQMVLSISSKNLHVQQFWVGNNINDKRARAY